MVPFLALLQFIYFAGHLADAISIEDMIFPAPAYTGDKPPSVPLIFKGGVPTADFALGTPPQNFTGVFDTGSPITWVMSTECRDTGCENVPMSEKFNRTASTTNTVFPTEIEIGYLDGTHVHLKPEFDTVTLAENYKFPRHLIGEATMVGYPADFVPAANARIGVGDYSNKILDPNPSKISKDFNAPVGGGLQRRAAGDAHTSTGPTVSGSPGFRKRDPNSSDNFLWVLGDDPSMYTGPLYKLALISGIDNESSPFWKVPLKGLALKGQGKKEYALSGGSYGTVSSSTPYIMVPPSVASALNNAIGAKYQANTRMYTIACVARKKLPSLVVEFSQGLNAEIPASQYINEYEHIPNGQSDACFSTIVNGPDDHTVYLGGPFFRSYYLGFAVMEQALYVAQSAANTGATLTSTSNGAGNQQSAPPPAGTNPQVASSNDAPALHQPSVNAPNSPTAAPPNGGTAAAVAADQKAPSSHSPGSSIGGQKPGSLTASENDNTANEGVPSNGNGSTDDANPTQPNGGNQLKGAKAGANPDAGAAGGNINPGSSTDGSGNIALPVGTTSDLPSGKLAPTSPNRIAPEGSTFGTLLGSSPGQTGQQLLK